MPDRDLWVGDYTDDTSVWLVGWNPNLATFYAKQHAFHNGPDGAEEILVDEVGTRPGEITTCDQLQAAIGRTIPADILDQLISPGSRGPCA